jgi:hypothetical protein
MAEFGTVKPAPPRRPLPFASVAFVSAVILLITQGVAINLATTGSPAAATVIAQLLIGLTVIPFVLGTVALVRGPHRRWAIAAMMVSVIANPFILRTVLSFFGSL